MSHTMTCTTTTLAIYSEGSTHKTGELRLPDYLTVEETVSVLGYHIESVHKMARKGKLRADKKAGVWLIYLGTSTIRGVIL